jgi:transposase
MSFASFKCGAVIAASMVAASSPAVVEAAGDSRSALGKCWSKEKPLRGSALQRMSRGMLIPPGPIRVLVATKPVDFRKGMDGLAALVKEQLKADPFSGVIFCFRSKRATE